MASGTGFTLASGTFIQPVQNYSALPAANTVPGAYYFVEESQGTWWLPGSLGGTFYNTGLYYSNGTTWINVEVPFQATQVEVNAGTNNDKFVTPLTLTNWSGLSAYVPTSRILTINGLTQDLSANRTWTITTTGTPNRIDVTSGNGLTPIINISSSYVGQNSITTLGTITTGVWNGTAISNSYLANSSVTINGTSVSLGGSATITAAASSLTVGTTTVLSGTTTRVLYNNSGVVGEYTLTGIGTSVAMGTSPTFTTDITTPKIIGGSAVGSTLDLFSTSASGTSSVAGINFKVGNNGSVTALKIYNSGNVNLGNATDTSQRIFRIGQDTAFVDIGSWVGVTDRSAIYFGQATPSSSNYILAGGGSNNTELNVPTSAELRININNSNIIRLTSTNLTIPGTQQVGIGLTAGSLAARLHVIATTEQLRLGFDTNNYYSTTVGSTGVVTFNAVGTGASFTFSDGISLPYASKTSNYTITSSDYTIDCTANSFTVTLPTAVGIVGRIYNIKNKFNNPGTITLATTSSQTIDGLTTQLISAAECLTVQSDGANWIII